MASKKPSLSREEKAKIMSLCDYSFSLVDVNHIAVQSMRNKKTSYVVSINSEGIAESCTCPDHNQRLVTCKHMHFTDNLVALPPTATEAVNNKRDTKKVGIIQ